MRVVLDTNVIISALLFSGRTSELTALWQSGEITPLLSKDILDEYIRVLAYPKFHLTAAEIKSLIAEEVLPYVQIVRPRQRFSVIRRDPSDNKFIECAVAGKSRVIVSGDKDLLSLATFRDITIMTPVRFLESLGKNKKLR
ncbi:MAG: putative toxin-antitoxin system toxin component, PIN family [Deltaproteobacteria bacterium]|nr:putative toxin-antitoxin system toxin component, PIN family [Deltaproteobacteria bacterium]